MKSIALGAVLVAALSGCATQSMQPRYEINVSSLASPLANGKTTYILFPGDKNIDEGDLQFQEFASYLDAALKRRGYLKSQRLESADMVVMLSYKIGDPRTIQTTRDIPVFGQTGVASATTYGSTYRGGFTSTTNFTPTYGVTGVVTTTDSETHYTRSVHVGAYAPPTAGGKPVELWSTTIVSSGSSGDLRKVLPVMIRAAAPYLGVDTRETLKLIVPINSEP
ncbi:hypothetical protein ACUXAV_000411 [Cupriavidus metallidurans]|uniref:DUF4136 domain-containing protein n=1 Tax=Cupriavidus metallidurans TaxID=119219 RepID=UPI0004933F8B|nr:DUF4136 domain-containing protein [Cupriavidus metallidurans]MDE4918369.1 DUF4136 domain-containing protein [Cupriavidus metallidurans]